MKAETVFDICHAVYDALRELHGWQLPATTPSGEDATRAEDGGQRPRVLPTVGDYLADFARCGERALSPSRLMLFRTYYLGLGACSGCADGIATVPQDGLPVHVYKDSRGKVVVESPCKYEVARRAMGLTPVGWVNWTDEIRRKVGRELWRVRVYPPGKYFKEPLRPR